MGGPDTFEYEEPEDDCPNCGGEGYVASCLEEWACLHPEEGCDLCIIQCDWCVDQSQDAGTPKPSIETVK